MMKRNLLVMCALIATLFLVNSCKKDEEKQEQSLLIGKWKHTHNIINEAGKEEISSFDEKAYCLPLHEFLADGKYLYYNDHLRVDGKCNYDDISEEIWKVKDTKLYMYYDDEDNTPIIYKIEKLTDTELKLSSERDGKTVIKVFSRL